MIVVTIKQFFFKKKLQTYFENLNITLNVLWLKQVTENFGLLNQTLIEISLNVHRMIIGKFFDQHLKTINSLEIFKKEGNFPSLRREMQGQVTHTDDPVSRWAWPWWQNRPPRLGRMMMSSIPDNVMCEKRKHNEDLLGEENPVYKNMSSIFTTLNLTENGKKRLYFTIDQWFNINFDHRVTRMKIDENKPWKSNL